MRIVANEKLIQRNSQIAKYATFGGLALLVGALVINILALTRQNDPSLLIYVMVAFFVGFILTNIGTLFTNRWGRRPDKAVADQLKGLDERYTLYNFRLGAPHVLVGPSGAIVVVPKYQAGPVHFDGRKWTNPGARRGMFGLFNPDPLGNPVAEAAAEVDNLNRYLKKHAPNLNVTPQAVVIFMHPRAEVSAKDAALPVLHAKQLKEYIRRLPRDPGFRPKDLAAVAEGEPAKPPT
jgi:hypothetical protein